MVLVSHRYNFIYLKNYKTAGSSVESFFQQFCIDPSQQSSYTFEDNTDESITQYGIVSRRNYIKHDNSSNKIPLTEDQISHSKSVVEYIKYKTNIRSNDNTLPTNELVWYNHKYVFDVKEDLGDNMFNNYKKFCSVRNPYDVIVSSYYWDKYIHNTIDDFKEYCIKYCKNLSIHPFRNDIKRVFLDDIPVCDYYIRFENLKEDVEMILQKLGITDYDIEKFPCHKSNIRPKNTPYQSFYDNETKELVYNTYKNIIDYFGYTF